MKNLILLLGTIIIFLNCAYIRPKSMADIDSGMAAENAAVLFERGNDYFKRKDYGNALPAFEEIVDVYEGTESYEPALYLGAFCRYKLARFRDAVSFGEKYIKEFPNSRYYINALSLVGESYYNLADDYQATYYMTKYYVQSTDSTGRQKAFERIIEMLSGLSTADLDKLHRIFMAHDIDEHILYRLAQSEAQEGKTEDAERDFNLLLRRFPDTRYIYEAQEYKKFISLGEASGRAGILLPLTGKFSNIGQSLLKIIRSFENDRLIPFSLHVVDTKSDPIEATLAAARLVEEFSTDFLIAPVSSFEAFGIAGYAFGKSVPLILPMSSEARFESIPLVFTRGQTGEEQARAIARFSAYDLNIHKFAILSSDESSAQGIAHAFAQEIVRNNREIVAMVSFPADSITLKDELEAIKDKEPEAIFLAMSTEMIVNAAPQIAYYGLEDVTLLGTESFHNERVPRLGEKYVEGAIFVTPLSVDDAAAKRLKNAGLSMDEFSLRLYSVLWQLRTLTNYERTNLPRLIGAALHGTEVFSVYQIKDGEFLKLTDLSENAEH
jgi:branched-chain amino acid transport system substrate-binding protein